MDAGLLLLRELQQMTSAIGALLKEQRKTNEHLAAIRRMGVTS